MHKKKTSGYSGWSYKGYCMQCGWGFTHKQLAMANFCPHCGCRSPKKLLALNGSSQKFYKTGTRSTVNRQFPDRQRSFDSTEGEQTVCVRNARHTQPRIGKVTRLARKKLSGRAVMQFAIQHPIAAGVGVAFAGAGMMCAAPFLVAAGGAVAATGASIAIAGTVIGCLCCMSETPSHRSSIRSSGMITAGLKFVGMGLAIGGTIAFAGGVVVALGGGMAMGGVVLLYGGGAVAVGAATRQGVLWEKQHGYLSRGVEKLCDAALVLQKNRMVASSLKPCSTSRHFAAFRKQRVTKGDSPYSHE